MAEDKVTYSDLELLMKSNTETQKLFSEVLHAFEMSAKDSKTLLKNLSECGSTPVINLLNEIVVKLNDLEKKVFKWIIALAAIFTLLSVLINLIIG